MKKSHFIYGVIVFVIILLFLYGYYNSNKPGQYDGVAKCLTEKGVKMYGAYWCPHCAEQKRLFGKSFDYIDYIECAIPGDNSRQTEICIKENITGYPTWDINGERVSGTHEPTELASLAGC